MHKNHCELPRREWGRLAGSILEDCLEAIPGALQENLVILKAAWTGLRPPSLEPDGEQVPRLGLPSHSFPHSYPWILAPAGSGKGEVLSLLPFLPLTQHLGLHRGQDLQEVFLTDPGPWGIHLGPLRCNRLSSEGQ